MVRRFTDAPITQHAATDTPARPNEGNHNDHPARRLSYPIFNGQSWIEQCNSKRGS